MEPKHSGRAALWEDQGRLSSVTGGEGTATTPETWNTRGVIQPMRWDALEYCCEGSEISRLGFRGFAQSSRDLTFHHIAEHYHPFPSPSFHFLLQFAITFKSVIQHPSSRSSLRLQEFLFLWILKVLYNLHLAINDVLFGSLNVSYLRSFLHHGIPDP